LDAIGVVLGALTHSLGPSIRPFDRDIGRMIHRPQAGRALPIVLGDDSRMTMRTGDQLHRPLRSLAPPDDQAPPTRPPPTPTPGPGAGAGGRVSPPTPPEAPPTRGSFALSRLGRAASESMRASARHPQPPGAGPQH